MAFTLSSWGSHGFGPSRMCNRANGTRARAQAPAASPPNTAAPTKCTTRKCSPVSSCPSVSFKLTCCVITMFHPFSAQALPWKHWSVYILRVRCHLPGWPFPRSCTFDALGVGLGPQREKSARQQGPPAVHLAEDGHCHQSLDSHCQDLQAHQNLGSPVRVKTCPPPLHCSILLLGCMRTFWTEFAKLQ